MDRGVMPTSNMAIGNPVLYCAGSAPSSARRTDTHQRQKKDQI